MENLFTPIIPRLRSNTFWIDENGRLSLKFQYHLDIDGMTRGMQIDREGKYLIVTGVMSEKAYVFAINEKDGRLNSCIGSKTADAHSAAFSVFR